MPPSRLGDLYTFSLIGAGRHRPGTAWRWISVTARGSFTGEGHLSGTADSTGYYKNPERRANIQLELQSEDGTTLNNGGSQSVQVDGPSQSARFPLQVRALSVNGGATQGTIQAVINVTYTYA